MTNYSSNQYLDANRATHQSAQAIWKQIGNLAYAATVFLTRFVGSMIKMVIGK